MLFKAEHHRKILFSLEEKEIGRAQNEKSKEYFSVVWRAERAVAGLASLAGGGGEIRTHGRVAPTTIFKTVAFNRSATPPELIIITETKKLVLSQVKDLFPFPLELSEGTLFNRLSHISEKGLIKMEIMQGI